MALFEIVSFLQNVDLNKFDPIKGIETPLNSLDKMPSIYDLNKFDPIKGIET